MVEAREATEADREVVMEVIRVDESPPGTKQLLHQVFPMSISNV